MKIAPSILSSDFARLGEEIRAVVEAGADWIHVDVMDGRFVPNITVGPPVVRAARAVSELPLDVHLMIADPDRYLEAFVQAGADLLTVHQEACPHLHRTVHRIRELGARAGVALNPATPVDSLRDIAADLDLLLVMSVNPGFGGQAFIAHSYAKIQAARELLDVVGSRALLEVDGGVDAENVAELARSGVDVAVAGSAVYGHLGGAGAGMAALKAALG
ncbi:MAG: ribulose-phosphate 3-epimerase [Gemmatimonadota bacterium]